MGLFPPSCWAVITLHGGVEVGGWAKGLAWMQGILTNSITPTHHLARQISLWRLASYANITFKLSRRVAWDAYGFEREYWKSPSCNADSKK